MIDGLLVALSFEYLLLLTIGTLGGILVGSLPGLTATMGTALVVPFTFAMDPAAGLVILGGLYVGAMFADAIPACLVNTPGTPAALATSFDGFPLTQQGKAQKALVAAAFSSMIGATFGAVALLFLSPPLALFSLQFGPPEFFWIGVFALTIIGSIAGKSFLKGVTGGVIGLLLSTVGIAVAGGTARYTFGVPDLQGGIHVVVSLIGLFAIPQLLRMIEERKLNRQIAEYVPQKGTTRETVVELLRRPINLVRSSVIGVAIGILPGAGSPVASLVAYNETIRWSPDKHAFGKGSVHGVAAAETSNNSAATASIIPLLSLGIPGSPPAAVIFGALLLHGLRPGPELYTTHATMTYTFAWSMLLAAFVVFALGMSLSRLLARMVAIPVHILIPAILLICVVGSFAIRGRFFDVYVMFAVGVIGYLLGKLGFHPGPIALGIILGPIVEAGLVSSLSLVRATDIFTVFFARPISVAFIVMTIISILWLVYSSRRDTDVETKLAQAKERPDG